MRLKRSAKVLCSDQRCKPRSSRPRGAKCRATCFAISFTTGARARMLTRSCRMPEASEISVTLPTVASEIQVLKAMAAIKASHDAW